MKNNFGLSESEYALLRQLVIDPLESHGAQVWIFGSRARGTNSKFSDVDLMVIASEDLSGLIGIVSEAIIESNFPYKVDVVDYRNFAEEYKPNFEAEKIAAR